MKNFKFIFFLISVFFATNLFADRAMYFCCSPDGYCGLTGYESQKVCQQSCFGHNSCQARTVNVAPIAGFVAPTVTTSVAPVATAPYTGGVVSAPITTQASIVAGQPVVATQTPGSIVIRGTVGR